MANKNKFKDGSTEKGQNVNKQAVNCVDSNLNNNQKHVHKPVNKTNAAFVVDDAFRFEDKTSGIKHTDKNDQNRQDSRSKSMDNKKASREKGMAKVLQLSETDKANMLLYLYISKELDTKTEIEHINKTLEYRRNKKRYSINQRTQEEQDQNMDLYESALECSKALDNSDLAMKCKCLNYMKSHLDKSLSCLYETGDLTKENFIREVTDLLSDLRLAGRNMSLLEHVMDVILSYYNTNYHDRTGLRTSYNFMNMPDMRSKSDREKAAKKNNVDLDSTIKSVNNYCTNHLLSNFKNRKISGTESIKMVGIRGRVKITNGTDEREVGICKHDFMLELSKDPIELVSESLSLISSCLAPSTKSNSPSMIAHQAVSLSVGRSIKDKDVLFENKGNVRADLLVIDLLDRTIIDISGSKHKNIHESKYNQFANVISLNKYNFAPSGEEDIDFIFSLSRIIDNNDTDYMFDRIVEQAKGNNLKPFYSQTTLKFMSKGIDECGRTMDQHIDACLFILDLSLESRLDQNMEASTRNKQKTFDRDEINMKLAMDLKKLSSVKFDLDLENKYFSMPLLSHDDDYRYPKPLLEQDIKFIFEDDIIDIANIRADEQLDKDGDKVREYFSKTNMTVVHKKAYREAQMYGKQKIDNKLKELILMRVYSNIYFSTVIPYKISYYRRLSRALGLKYNENGDQIIYNPKRYKSNDKMIPADPIMTHKLTKNSCWYETSIAIDPDHFLLLNELTKCKRSALPLSYIADCISLLSKSRDYHELRFKNKIALAISQIRKPDSSFEILHFSDSRISAQVLIKGMILEKDRGVAYVSFLDKGNLYRTEKWRLPDIENYTVNHHRLISIISSLIYRSFDINRLKTMIMIYSRVLNENSWGLSKFLKAYRYYSHGYMTSSPNLEKTAGKLLESFDSSPRSKLSTAMIIDMMINSKKFPQKTCSLSLSFKHIGWEIFLVNLCPSNTYGKRKHFEDTMAEVLNELVKFDDHTKEINDLYNDFERILSDPSDLRVLYKEHFKSIDRLSKITEGRFTFSPIGVLIAHSELRKLSFDYSVLQTSLPHLSELMTAKASYNTTTGESSIANVSISDLSNKLKTNSTSLLINKILHKQGIIDLSMRMFDKDQIGGNREISILSSEFRMVQIVAEKLFEKLNRFIDNEMLVRSDKNSEFCKRASDAFLTDHRHFASIDQTRWGPNFNTSTFGMLLLSLSRYSTEFYNAALACFVSEFKIFEIPIWLPKLLDRSDSSYTIVGKMGRNHMGQGIFHNASSSYHALVTKALLSSHRRLISKKYDISIGIQLVQTSLVTSDDVSIMEYVHIPAESDLEDYNDNLPEDCSPVLLNHRECKLKAIGIINLLSKLHGCYSKIVRYFGIKTSSYKNIYSRDCVEFNSNYLSRDGIGSNEIKYMYSLIEPATTGSFTDDYSNVLNIYYKAINSGCSQDASYVLVLTAYIKFCRQWKIELSMTGFPSKETILNGLIRPITISDEPNDLIFRFETRSDLRFKLRNVLVKTMENTEPGLSREMLRLTFTRMCGTREMTQYRSIITHYKGRRAIVTNSSFYNSYGVSGESFKSFLFNSNRHQNYLEMCLNSKVQEAYKMVNLSKTTKKDLFPKIRLRSSNVSRLSLWQALVSSRSKVEFINNTHNDEEVFYHLMRDHWLGTWEKSRFLDEIETLSIEQKLIEINKYITTLEISEPRCSSHIYNPSLKEISYNSIHVINSTVEPLIDNKIQTIAVSELIDSSKMYASRLSDIWYLKGTEMGYLTAVPIYGYMPFAHGSRTTVTIPAFTLESICLHVNPGFYLINREWCSSKFDRIYLNINMSGLDIDLDETETQDDFFSNILKMADNEFEDLCLDSMDINISEQDVKENLREDDTIHKEKTLDEICCEREPISLDMNMSPSYFSIEAHLDASMYMDIYSTRVNIANAYLQVCKDLSVIQLESGSGDFLMREISSTDRKVYCFDKDIAKNINRIVQTSIVDFNSRKSNSLKAWHHLAKDIISGSKLVSESGIKHKVPLFASSNLVSITHTPIGQIKSESTMLKALDANYERLKGFMAEDSSRSSDTIEASQENRDSNIHQKDFNSYSESDTTFSWSASFSSEE